MKARISEFSYGFALTHELIGHLGGLTAAPIFPSLIEEGRIGGGYDVNLNAPGLPLFLQFKRSERLTTHNAREVQRGSGISVPYYRFQITAAKDSDQHDLLLALDHHPNVVLYAAPMFHTIKELDSAFLAGQVRQSSYYVSPGAIGPFLDEGAHHISFDGNMFVRCSEALRIEGFGVSDLEGMLRKRLAKDQRPLRAGILDEALAEAARAPARVRQLRSDRIRNARKSSSLQSPVLTREAGPDIGFMPDRDRRFFVGQEITRSPPPKEPADPDLAKLRRLADLGLRNFNAQLVIIQP